MRNADDRSDIIVRRSADVIGAWNEYEREPFLRLVEQAGLPSLQDLEQLKPPLFQ
jgi:hypothetical protein